MNFKDAAQYFYLHRGPILGSLIGLILAVAILIFGFFKVLFIGIFVVLGYYGGKKVSEDREFFQDRFTALWEQLTSLFKKR